MVAERWHTNSAGENPDEPKAKTPSNLGTHRERWKEKVESEGKPAAMCPVGGCQGEKRRGIEPKDHWKQSEAAKDRLLMPSGSWVQEGEQKELVREGRAKKEVLFHMVTERHLASRAEERLQELRSFMSDLHLWIQDEVRSQRLKVRRVRNAEKIDRDTLAVYVPSN